MISRQFNYAEAFLTLRCNMGCSYCINDVDGIKRERKELSAEEWIKALNRFDWEMPLTLGGGEPTLHRDFHKIVKGIKKETDVDLLTNLQFNIYKFMKEIKSERFVRSESNFAYKSIRVSYHPERMGNGLDLVSKVKVLQDNHYPIGIFGLNHPKNLEGNTKMSELCRQSQVYFFIKDFLGEFEGHKFGFLKYPEALNGKRKRVLCRTKAILIGPEGNVYKCHRDLYHDQNELGNITDPNFKFKYRFRKCFDHGLCNPCDTKARINRFLQMGDCNVEIVK